MLREESLKAMGQGAARMSRVGLYRLLVVGGFVLALEALCRTGVISPRILIAPSEMASQLLQLLASGKVQCRHRRRRSAMLRCRLRAIGGGRLCRRRC